MIERARRPAALAVALAALAFPGSSETRRRRLRQAMPDLRGLAIKLGQMSTFELDLLPAGIRDALKDCAEDVPPLAPAQTRQLIMEGLGRPAEQCFDSFDPVPFAAASIGQVHAATRNGLGLAVKVQYPGLAASIRRDLRWLRGAMRVQRWSRNHLAVVDELTRMFESELDYGREVRSMARLRVLWEGMAMVPQPVPELCSATVLTMTRMEGAELASWHSARPAPSRRDLTASCLALWRSALREGVVHADPSPGNLKVGEGGLPVVLDYGSVIDLSPATHRFFVGLLEDRPFTIDPYRELGVLARHPSDTVDTLLRGLEGWIGAPLRDPGRLTAAHAGIGRALLAELVVAPDLRLHPDFVGTFRSFHQLFHLLTMSEA